MGGLNTAWSTKRVRFVTLRNLTSAQQEIQTRASQVTFLPMEAIGETGSVDSSIVKDIDDVKTGYTRFFNGDIVIARITPCFENGKGALIQELPHGIGFGTTELHVLTPSEDIAGRFLYYVTMSPAFRKSGEASMTGAAGQRRVGEEFVRNFLLPVPPLDKQRAIADYLDRETARIDALVAAKERWLEILEDKKRTLITQAVTRGLNPKAPLKDSGIAWLGQAPKHWETRRVAVLFRDRDERGETDLPLLVVSINTGVTLREFSDDKIEDTAADFNSYKIARRGDVVFNKMRMWQGAVGVAPQDGLVSPDYTVACPIGPIVSGYAELLFRTAMFSAECARNSHGIVWDRLRLYWEGFRDIRIPLPPLDEQHAIVGYIATETGKIDALRAAAEKTIELLKERRAALIEAAVTGKNVSLLSSKS